MNPARNLGSPTLSMERQGPGVLRLRPGLAIPTSHSLWTCHTALGTPGAAHSGPVLSTPGACRAIPMSRTLWTCHVTIGTPRAHGAIPTSQTLWTCHASLGTPGARSFWGLYTPSLCNQLPAPLHIPEPFLLKAFVSALSFKNPLISLPVPSISRAL